MLDIQQHSPDFTIIALFTSLTFLRHIPQLLTLFHCTLTVLLLLYYYYFIYGSLWAQQNTTLPQRLLLAENES